MNLTLRYMTLADIPQVVYIDRTSFGAPWSPRSYAYEINESSYSHMLVLDYTSEINTASRLQRLWQRVSGTGRKMQSRIVGYGGLWRVMEEAHISTIASHPDWRGHHFGEIMLAAMIRKALLLQASYIVLEVRVSNATAQNLYHKYQFNTVAVKRKYYRDNGEDAYDMRIEFDAEKRETYTRRFMELQGKHQFKDLYTTVHSARG